MKNYNVGNVLKTYRKRNSLSVRDVCLILRDDYQIHTAPKTIYGWESNQAHPTTDTFLVLCEIYQIGNISSIFGLESDPNHFPITADERQIILAYRQHPKMQEAIRQLLNLNTKE
jgi:hypothetical protein